MRDAHLGFGIFILLFLLYCFSINQIPHGTTDTAKYLVVAKSFYQGNGYKRISSPTNPKENIILPVYPMLLAPLFFFDGMIFVTGRFVSVLLTLGVLFVFYKICQKFFDRRFSLIVVLLFGLSPMVMIYSHKILTEIPFTLFSLTAILFTLKYAKTGKSKFLTPSLLFVTLAIFTRIVGFTLILSILLYLLFKRKYIQSVPYIIILLFFIVFLYNINYFWLSKVNSVEKPGEYGIRTLFVKYHEAPPLLSVDTLKIVGSNIVGYFVFDVPLNIAPFLIPFRDAVIPLIPYQTLTFRSALATYPASITFFTLFAYGIGVFIFLLILTGYAHRISEEFSIMHVYTLLFIILIVVAPVYPGNGRYILPVMPMIFIYFFTGLLILKKLFVERFVFYKNKRSHIHNLFVGLILISTLTSAFSIASFFHFRELESEWKAFFYYGEWIIENTNIDDIIASSRASEELYLYTGRKALDIEYITSLRDILNHNVSYIMIVNDFSQRDYELISGIVNENPSLFHLVYTNDNYSAMIYQTIKNV